MDYITALITDPAAWLALLTLTVMEVVLGIDNLLFISIITNRLPEAQRSSARRIGIAGALVTRLILLSLIAWIVGLTEPVFTAFSNAFSWRDLMLIAGGLFLVWKATTEIHHQVDPGSISTQKVANYALANVVTVITQILIIDVVFSIDSIITAVGMTTHLPIMVVAVVIAIAAMLLAADPLANFVHANPTVVMLVLGFLLLIGTILIADGFDVHIPRGYVYAAMAFSALVEGLNIAARRARSAKHSA